MTKHLLSDIPQYKQQQNEAKLLFRQMQIEEVSNIIRILPNVVIAHYRPVEDDLCLRIKIKLESIFKKIKKFFTRNKKRSVCVVKSPIVYQIYVWKQLREQLCNYLSNIIEDKPVSSIYFQQILRPLELTAFLCVEQAIQIAFLESLRYFNKQQLEKIKSYTESFNIEQKEDIPPFLFELKRALQWTFALREEWEAIKKKKRKEPENALENNAELVFK